MKKKLMRLVSCFMAVATLLGTMGFGAAAASAKNRLNQDYNVFIDAMDYLGYNIEDYRKTNIWLIGSILQEPYATTGITYGTGSKGIEKVVDSTTVSGYAPDLKHFKRKGFVCASFVSYVYLNYLPNVAGYDTSALAEAMEGRNYETVSSWYKATEQLVKKGLATKIKKKSQLEVGDIVFVDKDKTINDHVSVYIGKRRGYHSVIHCGNKRGPDFCNFALFKYFDDMDFAYAVRLKFPLKTEVSLSCTNCTYDGKVKKPTLKVTDAAGKTIDKKYYDVTYPSGRKNIGTYPVRVDFKGKYTGSRTVKFTISPKKSSVKTIKGGKKNFTVTWGTNSSSSGYQVKYSTNKSLKKATTVTYKGKDVKTAKISGLKSKTKYYVKVRGYRSVKVNGKWCKLYSSWSGTKNITTK